MSSESPGAPPRDPSTPAPPRDAASVIVVRPSSDGFEMLLTQRPKTMRFMGGAYVFPGGSVDPSDLAERAIALATRAREDLLDAVPSAGSEEMAAGLLTAAIRETFEETGILLCRDASNEWVRGEDFLHRRKSITESPDTFLDFIEEQRFVLATESLRYFGRLITPKFSPIRFDARFFVVELPSDARVNYDPAEVDDAIWISPDNALASAARSEIDLPIPTMAIVQSLAEAKTFDDAMHAQMIWREVLVSRVSPYAVSVLAPNPSMMTGPGTNTWVLGGKKSLIVDPAVTDPVYLEAVIKEAIEIGPCEAIVITHHHPDHTGGAIALSKLLKADLYAFDPESVSANTKKLNDGDVFDLEGVRLRAVHTPGHTADHVSLLVEEDRSLLAGDVVAGLGTVVIAPPDGNMGAYFETLRKLIALKPTTIFPGHGPLISAGIEKLEEYLTHRLQREKQVIDVLARGGPSTPAQIVAHIYADVDPLLHGVAEQSVMAHLLKLIHEQTVIAEGERFRLS